MCTFFESLGDLSNIKSTKTTFLMRVLGWSYTGDSGVWMSKMYHSALKTPKMLGSDAHQYLLRNYSTNWSTSKSAWGNNVNCGGILEQAQRLACFSVYMSPYTYWINSSSQQSVPGNREHCLGYVPWELHHHAQWLPLSKVSHSDFLRHFLSQVPISEHSFEGRATDSTERGSSQANINRTDIPGSILCVWMMLWCCYAAIWIHWPTMVE